MIRLHVLRCSFLGILAVDLVCAGQFKFPTPMEEPSPVLLWDTSLTLRSGGGHNSNPSLAYLSSARKPSAFLEYGGDLMFFRLPAGGDSAYVFISGDDRRYLTADEVPGEQNFIAVANYTHESPSWWRAGSTFSYVYLHQYLDLSEIDSGVGTARVRGNNLNFKPMVGMTWKTNWQGQLELPVSRQFFSGTAGDFLDLGPLLTFTRRLDRGSQVSLAYGWTRRAYDDTPFLTPDEPSGFGELEILRYNNVNLRWQQNWDADKHWSTTARFGLTTARDNGSGYYDYDRYRISGTVRYERKRWTLLIEGGVTWTDYLVQTVSETDSSLRYQHHLFASIRLEYLLWESLKWNAAFAYERSTGNLNADNYLVRTVSTGLEWEF